jgi:UDP-N-acetylglucosamine 2-epimerase
VSLSNNSVRCVTVLGTRPEIIKCSPLLPALDREFKHVLIHTGQHYDENMDGAFFRDLQLRLPDHVLGIGSGSQATQLAGMMTGIETILQDVKPHVVVVQGDTNSTLAGGLTAAKLGIPVAHIEAGCRSFNRAMPEEINRVILDHISEICFAPDVTAAQHLRNEGIPEHRIQVVGSTGIDACLRARQVIRDAPTPNPDYAADRDYLVVTIHRAENTTPAKLPGILDALEQLAHHYEVLFPVHPRTAQAMASLARPSNVRFLPPATYPEMIRMLSGCRALLTDSGGLQEEAAVLGIPTFILRTETEWTEFVDAGHHLLVGTDPGTIVETVRSTLSGGLQEQRMRQPLGQERAGASERILAGLRTYLASGPALTTEHIHQQVA